MSVTRIAAIRLAAAGSLFAVVFRAAWAQELPPLPQPLTLEHVLALADEAHPTLESAQLQADLARTELTLAQSRSGARAFLDLSPQQVQPSTEDQLVADSRARLIISKQLYDFGRTRALEQAANLTIAAREQGYVDARAQRRLEIMSRFLDVLLADARYAVDNESMALTYVRFDDGRQRHELGQLSDIDLLALENTFQEARLRRVESQTRQSAARHQLALALNRPQQIPAELAAPKFEDLDREIPEFKESLEAALQGNPRLVSARKEVEAARAAVVVERARRRPILSAEAEAAYYERNFASRDDLRASLNLRVPLYQGGEDNAMIARAYVRLREREVTVTKAELDLRDTVWNLLQEIETLKAARQAAKVRTSYRDLYLDRSRALYELELRTDLGDAMIRNSEAAWLSAQADYRLALAWARLSALTGNLVNVEERAQ